MSKIEATNNFIFVIRDASEVEKGGMIIPSQGVKKQHKGEIMSVGDLTEDTKIKSGVGRTCIFHSGVGFEITYDEQTYIVLTDKEIIGIV